MNNTIAKLVELLDDFPYELSDYISDNKHFIVDDHIELAKHLVDNGIIVQKHGKWIFDDDSIHCSICGYKALALIPYIDDGDKFIPLYANKYCGNCGAKMDTQ